MGSEEILERPYIAAMNGDWNGMVDFYKNNARYLVAPVTFTSDTGLHLAVHSNTEKPLKDLLEIMEGIESFLPNSKNKFGNTVLHEATIYGNYEAAGLLVRLCPDLLMEKNNDGETPLFTAASFGEAEIVKFLFRSEPERRVNGKSSLLEIHHQRGDGLSILSAAIIRQHFETALLLLDLDGSLHSVEDKKGRTAFESGVSMGICERLINCCLPVKRHHKLKSQVETRFKERKEQGDVESGQGRDSEDLESGSEWNQRGGIFKYLKVPKGCWLEGFWNQKTKHVFALKLAKLLIKKDESLNKVSITITDEEQGLGGKENEKGENKCTEITIKVKDTAGSSETNSSILTSKEHIPLFIATRNGIEVIVREILDRYPYAVEQLNEKGQSILHVAVMHRQEKIFSLVKQRKIPMARLHRVPDREGNTLLHHVAHMEHYRGGTRPGAALQLQEELQWYEQVQKVIPSHYATLQNKTGKTAEDLFKVSHKEQLENAQKWIKETTQFCSTVAAGVFAIVFAAAYTVPGGSDENGKPNFIDSPFFMYFTVSDALSLTSSVASLVVFLSLLTSPFQLNDFHISLPRKLFVGIFFLSVAVIATTICFAATIGILVQSERKSPSLLLSIAAFLPLLLCGTMEFRLCVFIMGSAYNDLKKTWKALLKSGNYDSRSAKNYKLKKMKN